MANCITTARSYFRRVRNFLERANQGMGASVVISEEGDPRCRSFRVGRVLPRRGEVAKVPVGLALAYLISTTMLAV